ncbi:uncharacterized protein [Ptychodera flava]|uniref:uncharacterized protein n=1 Tax=Ptychodera flava TaxID=63121 RepID=UPI00396A06E3
MSTKVKGLMERLADGETVIAAEGYLFYFERLGYLQSGSFCPVVILNHPEYVKDAYRHFVHAGSDVVEAFTYYANRQKLSLIDMEDKLELMNREALRLAREVADETGPCWREISVTLLSTTPIVRREMNKLRPCLSIDSEPFSGLWEEMEKEVSKIMNDETATCPINDPDDITSDIIDQPITEAEIVQSIKFLKDNKSLVLMASPQNCLSSVVT